MRGLQKAKRARTGKEAPHQRETNVEDVEADEDPQMPLGLPTTFWQHDATLNDHVTWDGVPQLPRARDESGTIKGASTTRAAPFALIAEQATTTTRTTTNVGERLKAMAEPSQGPGDSITQE